MGLKTVCFQCGCNPVEENEHDCSCHCHGH